jgi:hypothetical protein
MIARLALNRTDALDAGYSGVPDRRCEVDPLLCDPYLPAMPTVPFEEHPKFKYLLNCDGIVAAYRLSNLMHINSLILKQDSPWMEYFYRSIRQDEHYVTFYNTSHDDVFKVSREIRGVLVADSAHKKEDIPILKPLNRNGLPIS